MTRWPCVLTLSDVVDPWARILEGNDVPFFEGEHGGKQVMFGIRRVIMMLDLWMISSFGEKFRSTTQVVLAWDMLLKGIRIANIATCIKYSASLRKRTLGIVL